MVDCYGCQYDTVDDLTLGYRFLEDAVKMLGVFKQSPPFIFHSPETGPNGEDWSDKRGLSGWVPLIESGIQLHTLCAKNFISIDYYTCSEISDVVKKKLIDLAKSYFYPKRVDSKLIKRGVDYYD